MQVQDSYGQPNVVVLSFSEEQQNVGVLQHDQTAIYLQYMAFLASEINRQQLNKTRYLQLRGDGLPLSNWCAAHPSAEAHAVIAEQLASFLESFLPGWGGLNSSVVEYSGSFSGTNSSAKQTAGG